MDAIETSPFCDAKCKSIFALEQRVEELEGELEETWQLTDEILNSLHGTVNTPRLTKAKELKEKQKILLGVQNENKNGNTKR